ncbi:MAG: glycine cleavage system aminomethyltransferase GcvT [Endomicrobium sp.]|jgi:aminomethyltransferase|nr:glycine cleavage system aminomethyltransferase GcvT [Endomicrobium sp.]
MKKTDLYNEHEKLGAKFMEFNGWKMPIKYTSIIDEHNAVRTNIGIFDIGHMGVFTVVGNDAEKFLNSVTLGNVSGLINKKARYSMILNDNAGIKDDIIIYKIDKEYMIVVNAVNFEKDYIWLNKHKTNNVEINDISSEIYILAIQGCGALDLLQSISLTDIYIMKKFTISNLQLNGINADFCRIARTGYTGEDGFEIFISKKQIIKLWEKFMTLHVKPCGLGCRDTLRRSMPLYGHEIDESINPIEVGFEKIINWDNNFIGKNKLLSIIKTKPLRKLVNFECISGSIARSLDEVYVNNNKIGYVTSGSFSPTLKKSIGRALISTFADENKLEVNIHNKMKKIKVVSGPFYKR